MPIPGSVANLPVIGPWLTMREQNQTDVPGQQMQQMNQFATLQQSVQKGQMQQAAAHRDAQFRQRMAGARSDEERAQIAMEAEGAKGVLQHLDRKSRDESTAATNLSRLAQQAGQFDQNMQLRWSNAKDAREKALVESQWKQGRLAIETAQAQIAGKNLQYNTGSTVDIPQTPMIGVPGAAPQQAMMQGQAPNEAAAVAAINAGGGRPMSIEIPTQSPAAAVTAPMPAQQGAPVAAPVAAPQVVPQPGQGVPGVRAAQPAAPTLADAPAGLSPRDKAKWLMQQTKPSISGAAALTPETLNRIAQQAVNGDFSGVAGYARNQTAKAAIENEITRLSTELGLTGGDIAGKKADNKANAVALSAVTKDLAAITPFKEMLDTNAKVAIDLGRKIDGDKTNSAYVNKPLLWLKNNMSDRPDIAEYLAQMHFVEVEAARVLTQPRLVGQLTDQAIKDMKSVVDGSMTIASTEAVLNRILSDGKNRIGAMETQRKRNLDAIRGVPPNRGSASEPQYPTATAPNGRKAIFKDGKWQTLQP